MAYNKFKLPDLETQFLIQNFQRMFLPLEKLPTFEVSERLLADLVDARKSPIASEKAKSEFIILPLLKELHRKNSYSFSYFSGYEFNVDAKKGLNGFCDFIFSAEPEKLTIESPIICLLEAKKGEIEEGLGQCAAEMYAAQLFNERAGKPQSVIFGCVTNAFSWCFLKLEDKNLYIDPNYIPLTFTEPQHVLSVFQWMLSQTLYK
jgi:hypothetical protein